MDPRRRGARGTSSAFIWPTPGNTCDSIFFFQAEDGIRDWSVTGVQTCALPISQELDVRAGHRVLVPLGKRRVVGIALEPVTRVAPGVELRDILRVLDPEPLLSPELLTLGLWIAEYYVAPIGEVFRTMLPLRAETRRVRLVKLTEVGRQKLKELEASLLEEARRGPEADLLRYLAGRPGSEPAGVPIESLRTRFSAFRDLVPQALEEGWIGVSEVERERGQRKTFSVRLAGPASDAGA